MSSLIIKLQPGQFFIVNGALFRAVSRSQIEVSEKADVFFGRWVLSDKDATTPLRKAYLAIQKAYIGQGAERDRYTLEAALLIEDIALESGAERREELATLLADIRLGRYAKALRVLRPLIRQEEKTGVRDTASSMNKESRP